MNESRMASIVESRYSSLKGKQADLFNQVEQYRQMYRSFMTSSDAYPWDYQLTDPQIFPLMRAYLARLNPSEAKVLLEGQDPNREVNQQVINWEMNEILITQVLYRLMFSGFMAGKGYVKTGWKYEPALKIKENNKEFIMKDITNRADIKSVRFSDMFIPNRNIPEMEEQPYIIERVSMRYGEMLDQNETDEYWKADVLKKIKEKNMFTNKVDFGVDLPEDDSDSTKDKEDSVLRSQYVKMICMHTHDGEVFYTLENQKDFGLLNKSTENPYWHGHYPYLDFTPFPEDDEFFTMGIVQPVADLQVSMSSVLNQLLTNARKAGNPMWIAGQGAAQTPDWAFVNRPDGIIRVTGDIGQVQPVKMNDTSGPLLNLRQELQVAFERGSSLSSLFSSGVASTPQINKTATGAKIIEGNMDTNLQLLVSLFGAQILKRVGEHFLELNPQFITEKQSFEITGKEGESQYITVDPSQISANFKVKATPERMLKESPALKQAALLNLFTTLTTAKQSGAPINLRPVTEALVDAFPETEEINNIVIDPEKTANEVIAAVMKGFKPIPATYDDEHKILISIIQKYLIENQHVDNNQLQAFHDYIQDCQLWVQSKQQMVVPPNTPPPLQSLNPQDLAQSMGSQVAPPPSPDSGLPIPMSPMINGGNVNGLTG